MNVAEQQVNRVQPQVQTLPAENITTAMESDDNDLGTQTNTARNDANRVDHEQSRKRHKTVHSTSPQPTTPTNSSLLDILSRPITMHYPSPTSRSASLYIQTGNQQSTKNCIDPSTSAPTPASPQQRSTNNSGVDSHSISQTLPLSTPSSRSRPSGSNNHSFHAEAPPFTSSLRGSKPVVASLYHLLPDADDRQNESSDS